MYFDFSGTSKTKTIQLIVPPSPANAINLAVGRCAENGKSFIQSAILFKMHM